MSSFFIYLIFFCQTLPFLSTGRPPQPEAPTEARLRSTAPRQRLPEVRSEARMRTDFGGSPPTRKAEAAARTRPPGTAVQQQQQQQQLRPSASAAGKLYDQVRFKPSNCPKKVYEFPSSGALVVFICFSSITGSDEARCLLQEPVRRPGEGRRKRRRLQEPLRRGQVQVHESLRRSGGGRL